MAGAAAWTFGCLRSTGVREVSSGGPDSAHDERHEANRPSRGPRTVMAVLAIKRLERRGPPWHSSPSYNLCALEGMFPGVPRSQNTSPVCRLPRSRCWRGARRVSASRHGFRPKCTLGRVVFGVHGGSFRDRWSLMVVSRDGSVVWLVLRGQGVESGPEMSSGGDMDEAKLPGLASSVQVPG